MRPTSLRLAALAALLLSTTAAAAETPATFDLWRFAVPAGWGKAETPGLYAVSFDRGQGKVQIGIYRSRAPDDVSTEAEVDREWKEVVEASYATDEVKALDDQRLPCGCVAHGRAAATRDAAGTGSFTVLFVLAPYGRVASVLVHAPSAQVLGAHAEEVDGFLRGLRLDDDAVARELAGRPGAVEDRRRVVGRWATSARATSPNGLALTGTSLREYRFGADGTYAFRAESWGGSLRSEEWFLVDETGTWTLERGRLALRPAKTSGVVKDREGKVLRRSDPELEPAVYGARLVLFEGLGETQLVLTPAAETSRDGAFAANVAFKSSYLLSSAFAPEWRSFPR